MPTEKCSCCDEAILPNIKLTGKLGIADKDWKPSIKGGNDSGDEIEGEIGQTS